MKPAHKTNSADPRIEKIINALREREVELQIMAPDLDQDAAEKVWDALSDLTDAIETLREIEVVRDLK